MPAPTTWLFQQAIIIAAILLGVIIFYFFVSLIRQQRRNLELYRAKVRAEITTLENERKRIASDLHDDVGPLLSSVKLHVNNIDGDPENNHLMVQKSTRQIDDIIKRMKDISANLLPNTLVLYGLKKAVAEYVEKMSEAGGLKINFLSQGDYPLTQEQEINVYRIVQEITHNTLKHAGATELTIELRQNRKTLWLTTRDNGKGFDIQRQMGLNSGLGLLNLRSRAEVLDAKLTWQSGKGTGTSYNFEIPLQLS
jgi:two-component system, NarL family, sensor kinase